MTRILLFLLLFLPSLVFADTKITDLTELGEKPATDDVTVIVDVSDTTMSTSGTTKKITRANYLGGALAIYDGITPSANVQSLLGAADYAAMRVLLTLTIGTDVQAYDADLDTYAGITPSSDVQTLLAVADYDAARTALGLAIGSDVQAYNAGLTAWTSWVDPNKTALLEWDDVAGAFAIYAPTAWRIFYSGASSALSEVAFGDQYSILQSGGPSAAPTWVTSVNWSTLVVPSGTNPAVTAAGSIALDTDAANEASDAALVIGDGTNTVLLARKLHCIQGTIIKPQDLADAQRDKFCFWCNNTGMVFTITEIKGYSDTDNTTLTINLVPDTDWTSITKVDDLEIATNSTGVFTGVETTITHATVSHDECLVIDFDDTDNPGFVKLTVCGWFNAAVD